MPFFAPPPRIGTEVFTRLPDRFRRPRATGWARWNRGGREIDSFLEGPCLDAEGRLYLTDIGQYPLLTKDDEVRLAQQIGRLRRQAALRRLPLRAHDVEQGFAAEPVMAVQFDQLFQHGHALRGAAQAQVQVAGGLEHHQVEAQQAHRTQHGMADVLRVQVAPPGRQAKPLAGYRQGALGDPQGIFQSVLIEVVAIQSHQYHQLLGREEPGAQQQIFALPVVLAVVGARFAQQTFDLLRERIVEIKCGLVEIHQVHDLFPRAMSFLMSWAMREPHRSSAAQVAHWPSTVSPCLRNAASSDSMRSIRQAMARPTGSGIR